MPGPLLEGRVAIVTGGASGIGRASAIRLAGEGAHVAIGDIDVTGATAVADEITAGGGGAFASETDVSEEASFRALVEATCERFGRLDVLHNNAAALGNASVGQDDAIDSLEVDVWDRTMAIIARSVMLGCKHAIPRMLESGGGSIVNTSSGAAILGGLNGTAYAVSKAAVNALTQYVATQYGKRGIRCNAILPGLMDTPMAIRGISKMRGIPEDELRKERAARVPMGFMGSGWDTAHAALFLASDEARFITGALLPVDGGRYISPTGSGP